MIVRSVPNKETEMIRTIFMGTPDFSCPGLKALIDSKRFKVVAVFTQPDKPVGREQKMTPPPVKVLAESEGIKVYQPEKLRTETDTIAALDPELIVVIAYGKILPPSILSLPKYGCVNVHASLLPKYRGSACLNAAILNGDTETGITFMQMEAGLDTGPILKQSVLKLEGNETLEDLHDELSVIGANDLIPTLEEYIDGHLVPQPQDESQASYVPLLKKEDGRIDWKRPAHEIERQVRGLTPWPGTFCLSGGKKMKILEVDNTVSKINFYKVGQEFLANGRLAVQCGQDAIVIKRLLLEGGRPMSSEEFLRGHELGMLE